MKRRNIKKWLPDEKRKDEYLEIPKPCPWPFGQNPWF